MRKTKKLKKEVKRLKIENKKIENEKKTLYNYANKWKNEWYKLNYESSIMHKKIAIANIDLYLNKFYIKALATVAITELIIILFKI